jgi:hypothetical protein
MVVSMPVITMNESVGERNMDRISRSGSRLYLHANEPATRSVLSGSILSLELMSFQFLLSGLLF